MSVFELLPGQVGDNVYNDNVFNDNLYNIGSCKRRKRLCTTGKSLRRGILRSWQRYTKSA